MIAFIIWIFIMIVCLLISLLGLYLSRKGKTSGFVLSLVFFNIFISPFSIVFYFKNKQPQVKKIYEFTNSRMKTAYAFMIVGTILISILIFSMCWTIPMTIKTKKLIHHYRPCTNLGVCSILFVSIIGGVLILNNRETDYLKNNSIFNQDQKLDTIDHLKQV